MAAFGARPSSPQNVGGGDLWEEPESPPRRKWSPRRTIWFVAVASTVCWAVAIYFTL